MFVLGSIDWVGKGMFPGLLFHPINDLLWMLVCCGVFFFVLAIVSMPKDRLAFKINSLYSSLNETIDHNRRPFKVLGSFVVASLCLNQVLTFFGKHFDSAILVRIGSYCELGAWISASVFALFIGEAHADAEASSKEKAQIYNMNNYNSGNQFIDSTVTGGTQHAQDNSVTMVNLAPEQLVQVRDDLSKLRSELLHKAQSREHYVAIGEIAAAEQEAANGDETGMRAHLLKAGHWAFDVATKASTTLLAEYLKSATGIK